MPKDISFNAFRTTKNEDNKELNKIIQEEIRAVKVYQRAIEHSKNSLVKEKLIELKNHHFDLLNFWKSKKINKDSINKYSSGHWSELSESFNFNHKINNEIKVVEKFNKAENKSLKSYLDLIDNSLLEPLYKYQIRRNFLPIHREKIFSLRRLITELEA